MKLAEKFRKPILTLVDTPGAYPGIGAEERGQAEAIAFNLREMARLRVPVVVSVIGEGGSGGALGIAVGNRILMQENAVYSVISPESCSAILWKDQLHAEEAARNLGLTAKDLERFGLIDEIVPEPPGGAHADWDGAARLLGDAIERQMADLATGTPEGWIAERQDEIPPHGRRGVRRVAVIPSSVLVLVLVIDRLTDDG